MLRLGKNEQSRRRVVVHVVTVPDSLHFFSGQGRALRARGFDLVGVSAPGPAAALFSAREQVPVHTIEMHRKISPVADLLSLARLIVLLRRLKPSIVHSHTPKGGLLGTTAALLAGVRVRIYHIHGFPFETAGGWRRVLLMLTERMACRLATHVLSVSRSTAAMGLRRGIAPQIGVLADGSINGVDASKFDPTVVAQASQRVREMHGIPANAIVLGFIGRLVRDKGIQELYASWRELRERFSSLHLLVVGPFEQRDGLPDALREQLEADVRVHLHGADWDTPQLFGAMDVVVLPSYREGFPVVPMEAGAMQRPVVATAVTGCVDAVVDGVTGTLVRVNDVDELTKAIERYIVSPELRRSHGRAARDRMIRLFSPGRLWAATADFYEAALAGRNAVSTAD